MDFVPVTENYPALFVFLGLSVAFIGAFILFDKLMFDRRPFKHTGDDSDGVITVKVGLVFSALVCLMATLALTFWNMGQLAVREETVASQLQEAYGIFPSPQNVRQLEYPDARPEGRYEKFGSFQLTTGEEAVLVWKVNEFQLGTMNGKKFVEFERVD